MRTLATAAAFTVTRTAPASRSGTMRTDWMGFAGTSSSHTVPQMPLLAANQTSFGFSACLPRGCPPESVGSQARTTISCGPLGFRAAVTSRANGS